MSSCEKFLADVVTTTVPALHTALERAWQRLAQPPEVEDTAHRVKRLAAKICALRERVLRATELLADGTIGEAEYYVFDKASTGN